MKRPARLRMVLVVVCLCVIGCPFVTQGQQAPAYLPFPGQPAFLFCPPGHIANDVQTSPVTGGQVQIEECVTRQGSTDTYSYRVTNQCPSYALCEFKLPNNTGNTTPCFTSLIGWTCLSLPGYWQWTASPGFEIAPGNYGDFWFSITGPSTVDTSLDAWVSMCVGDLLVPFRVKTTGPGPECGDLIIDIKDSSCKCVVEDRVCQCVLTVTAVVTNLGPGVVTEIFDVTLATNCGSGDTHWHGGVFPASQTWTTTLESIFASYPPCPTGCSFTVTVDYWNEVVECPPEGELNNEASQQCWCQGPQG